MFALLAQTTTTVEEVPRVVGDPLSGWIVVLAGMALLAVIAMAAVLLRRRS